MKIDHPCCQVIDALGGDVLVKGRCAALLTTIKVVCIYIYLFIYSVAAMSKFILVGGMKVIVNTA